MSMVRIAASIADVSDELWDKIRTLLPARDGTGQGGRPATDRRLVLAGVLHVLRTGCAWKDVPRAFGSGSTLHRYYLAWSRAGVFERLWRAGLAEHEEMEGIAWRWSASVPDLAVPPAPGRRATRTWQPAVERRFRAPAPPACGAA